MPECYGIHVSDPAGRIKVDGFGRDCIPYLRKYLEFTGFEGRGTDTRIPPRKMGHARTMTLAVVSGLRALPVWMVVTGLAAVSLLAVWPLLWGGTIEGWDGHFHKQWSFIFAEQVLAGDLYPRWLAQSNFGLGSPAFYFYGPIPYYISTPLYGLLAGDITKDSGWNYLGGASALGLFLMGLGTFLWTRRFTTKLSALLAALFVMLSPYIFAYDVYIRFGYAEFWAAAMLPFCMIAVSDYILEREAHIGTFAIFYALAIMCHLPTAIIFSMCLCVVVGLTLASRRSVRGLPQLAIAAFLGLAISALYLSPVIFDRSFISPEFLVEKEIFRYSNNFMFSNAHGSN